jgi:radical SAM protein with 4Fe4S-binding SPASM domain
MGTLHRPWLRSSGADPLGQDHFIARGFTPAPLLVQWLVTQECRLACEHCLAATDRPTTELTLDEIARLLDEIASMGVPELLLTGGEPLDRPDLPQILAMIAERRIPWSLNTARLPGPEVRAAIEAWPPLFAAVSLDGPAELHDKFRGRPGAHAEACQALRFFDQVTSGQCAAGTTVSQKTLPYLSQTLQQVKDLGLRAWGLHLVVPEGRAATRRDLLLGSQQVRRLLDFIAETRTTFPVSLADEVGFVGDWEPRVRDTDFFCGAGRTQCVILANGDVVPCTTVDPSAVVGSIRNATLTEIWRNHFAAFRPAAVDAKCTGCEYVNLCGGACWLQRRHGTQCFRQAWQPTPARRTMATLTLSAALLTTVPDAADAATLEQGLDLPSGKGGKRDRRQFELALAQWLEAQDTTRITWANVPPALVRALPSQDPLHKYLGTFGGVRPPIEFDAADSGRARLEAESTLAATCDRVQPVLRSATASMSVLALLWRDLGEAVLGATPAERSQHTVRVGQLLEAMAKTAGTWRNQAPHEGVDPFLSPGGFQSLGYKRCAMMKAGAARCDPAERRLRERIRERRWGMHDPNSAPTTSGPIWDADAFSVSPGPGTSGTVRTATGTRPLAQNARIGLFDRLVLNGHATLNLALPQSNESVAIKLAADREVSVFELVAAADEQHRSALVRWARQQPEAMVSPLFIPLLREARALARVYQSDRKHWSHEWEHTSLSACWMR